MCAWCSLRLDKDLGAPGSEVTDVVIWVVGTNPGPLEEKLGILTVEPAPQIPY